MKSRYVIIAFIVSLFYLFDSMGFCEMKDANVTLEQWSKIVESKVAEMAGNSGIVNYEDGYIEAIGMGAPPKEYYGDPNARPMALRAAQVDAYRNLLEITKGVQLDTQTIFKDFIARSDIINTQVSGNIKNAKVTNRIYLPDGSVEVTVRMYINGNKGLLTKDVIDRVIADDKKKDSPTLNVIHETALKTGSEVFTGLVIDARGVGGRPAMSPKIIDESGGVVYGSSIVISEYASQNGICGYAKNLTAAQSNNRVTNNPITIKGISAEGLHKADIKISNADAQKLRSESARLDFFKQCKVMIVLD